MINLASLADVLWAFILLEIDNAILPKFPAKSMGNTSIIYKLSDGFSLIVIKCLYSKLLAYIHKSNFNIRHVYAYIHA